MYPGLSTHLHHHQKRKLLKLRLSDWEIRQLTITVKVCLALDLKMTFE